MYQESNAPFKCLKDELSRRSVLEAFTDGRHRDACGCEGDGGTARPKRWQ
jgi:hypothetical protein